MRELKTCRHKSLHTNVHSNIIIIAKKRKQTQCLPTDEWINKKGYISTMECVLFGNKKGDEVLLHVTVCINLENITLSERRQPQNATLYDLI